MQNKRVGVTIARNAGAAAQVIGRQWAEQLGVPYFDRPQNSPVDSLLKEQQLTALIVVEKMDRVFMVMVVLLPIIRAWRCCVYSS